MSQNREIKATNISTLENTSVDHEDRIEGLESSIEASALITDAEQKFAKVIAGGEDNIAKFWKVRHHVMMASIGNGEGSEGADFEQINSNDRFMFDPNFTIVSNMNANAQSYLGNSYFIEKDEQIQFKIKKGENFFWIGTYLAAANASVFRVYIDGVNVNTLGLVDENGNTVASSFTAFAATTKHGMNYQFYGLDGEEHVLTIKNEDGSALQTPLNYVDVGYRSQDYAIDHTLNINSGIASVNAVPTEFNEESFTFTEPGEGLANGYTGMIKINQSGVLTKVDGLSPAATQSKPNSPILFSSGPVTSLLVKNNFAFPDDGICLFTHPSGETSLFSYNGKTDTTPQNHSLNNIKWQSQPTENYTPLVGPSGVKRISTITNTNAGNSVNLDVVGAAKKVTLYAARPTRGHYFWFNVVGGVNTQFDPGGGTNVDKGYKVDVLTTDTANDVATKLGQVIAATGDNFDNFTVSVTTNVVTVTNYNFGAVTATASTATGTTVATPTAGVNPTYLVNTFRGDARIEYWAKAPILIDNTNNKVDFQITVNGVTTLHVATLENGCYSADLVSIEKVFRTAMRTAKPINGLYFLSYNKDSQFWSIGVNGNEQTSINFLFSSGVNSANSLGSTLGFTEDKINKKSYVANDSKQHLAQRVFVKDQTFRATEHPSIKYSWAVTAQVSTPDADQLLLDLGLPSYRRQASAGTVFYIYPDDDCCGLTLSFMREDISTYITYQIDDGDVTYIGTMARPNDVTSPTKGALINAFISFPKGSRKITVKPETQVFFEIESSTEHVTFFGYRQWFTKPPWETLKLTEKILRTVEVNPIRLFATNYGNNVDLYAPKSTNDNIDSLTDSGTEEITNLTNTNVGSFFDVVGNARKFNIFAAPSLTVGEQHYFWFNVTNGANTQNDPGGPGIGHQVDILTGDTRYQVMDKLRIQINLLTTKFSSEIRNPDTAAASVVLTVRNVFEGAVSPVTQGAVTSGFTIVVENAASNDWTQNSSTSIFSGRWRGCVVYGGYIDLQFTLQGDGGGVGMMSFDNTSTTQAANVYLSNTTINETTDLIERMSSDSGTTFYDHMRFQHLGLKAGTYRIRIKNNHTQNLVNQCIIIYDTIQPQIDATTHSDLANAGQGLAYPVNVRRRNFQRYGLDKQPSWMTEGIGKIGLVNMTDYFTNTNTITNFDDSTSVNAYGHLYWSQSDITLNGGYFQVPFIGRSVSMYLGTHTSRSTSMSPSIDGIVSSNISLREAVKGGTTSSTTRTTAGRLFVKNFDYPISHSGGLVFTMLNTQGLRSNQKAILVDGSGNKEEVFITNIVSNTSFTIKKSLTIISAAAVVKILFGGFHNVKVTNNDAVVTTISAIEYEPLPLEWSILEERVSTVTSVEIKQLNLVVSVGAIVGNVGSFEYPFHSDGEQGTPLTSEIEFLRAFNSQSRLDRPLKALINILGTAVSTYYMNIRSRRNIKIKGNIGKVRG